MSNSNINFIHTNKYQYILFLGIIMFKNRLRFVREQKKMTQAEFAALANLGISAQTNYERGLRAPDLNYMEALAKHGVDIGYLLTGIPTDMSALSDDEKELLQNYRMVSSLEKQAILAVSKVFTNKDDSSDDQEPGSEDKGLSRVSKKSSSKKKSAISSLMTIARETILHRTIYYSTRLTMPILLAIIGFAAISYVMMIGSNFNAPEYNWLAITAYIVMNVGLVAVLSKFIINKFSLLCEKDQKLES
jgi:transcriptional regulator with XRE-family HTH domain